MSMGPFSYFIVISVNVMHANDINIYIIMFVNKNMNIQLVLVKVFRVGMKLVHFRIVRQSERLVFVYIPSQYGIVSC